MTANVKAVNDFLCSERRQAGALISQTATELVQGCRLCILLLHLTRLRQSNTVATLLYQINDKFV